MIPIRVSIAVTALAAGAGCAHNQPLTLEEPIGPVESPAVEIASGSLIVYSNTESLPADPEHRAHVGYAIYTDQGELLRKVDNRAGPFGASPMLVNLPTGRYKVVAKSSNRRLVAAQVVIRDRRTTVVDLNREVMPQGALAREDWVRLPSGAIVGARSSELANAQPSGTQQR